MTSDKAAALLKKLVLRLDDGTLIKAGGEGTDAATVMKPAEAYGVGSLTEAHLLKAQALLCEVHAKLPEEGPLRSLSMGSKRSVDTGYHHAEVRCRRRQAVSGGGGPRRTLGASRAAAGSPCCCPVSTCLFWGAHCRGGGDGAFCRPQPPAWPSLRRSAPPSRANAPAPWAAPMPTAVRRGWGGGAMRGLPLPARRP